MFTHFFYFFYLKEKKEKKIQQSYFSKIGLDNNCYYGNSICIQKVFQEIKK